MKYEVKIGTPNKMFFVKGKLVRSPLEWIADKSELKNIHMKIASEGITDYSIVEFNPTKITSKQESTIKKKQVKTKERVTKKKPITTLDKLLDESE